MRSTAYLINTVRGPIVDQKALTRVLSGEAHRRRRPGRARAGAVRPGRSDPDARQRRFRAHALCWTDQCFAGNGAADVRAMIDVQYGRTPRGVVNREMLSIEIWKKRLAGFAKPFAEQETPL
jgi:hypothetical protein